MSDMQALRAELLTQAETLTRRVEKIESHLRGVDREAPDDWSDRAQFLENDAVLEALDDQERAQVVQIRAAIARIDAGTYGVCSQCEEPIAPGRLQALPSTTSCIRCAT